MGIENLIANGITPPAPGEDMNALNARAISLKTLMQQQKLGALQLQQAQRGVDFQTARMNTLFGPGGAAPQIGDVDRQMAGAQPSGPQIDLSSVQPGASMPAPAAPAQPEPQRSPAMSDAQMRYQQGMARVRALIAAKNPLYQDEMKSVMDQYKADSDIEEKQAIAKEKTSIAGKNTVETQGLQHQRVAASIHSLLKITNDNDLATAWQHEEARLMRDGDIPQGTPDPFPGRAQLQQMEQSLTDPEKYAKTQNEEATGQRAAALAPSQLAESQDKAKQQAILTQQYVDGGMPLHEAQALAQSKARDAETAKFHKGELGMRGAQLGIEQQRLNLQKQLVVPQDDQTLDMQADAFHSGVPLNQIVKGQGNAAAAQARAIQARAVQKYPGMNLALSQSGYKGDTQSLTGLKKSLDSVSAFENTAIKNMQMFTDLAEKIPDTGVPWLNTPVRLLDEKLVGSKNMAAVNAARQVGLTEIAKITNNPNLSGQLSDSARHEIMSLSPTNATLPQILAVAKIVKQDAANRRTGLQDQINTVQGRIGGKTAAPAATHVFNPQTGKIEAK